MASLRNTSFLFALILVVLSGCVSIKTTKVTEPFDAFYDRFHEDMDFQLSRVQFPLAGSNTDADGESVWKKNQWVPHRQKVTSISDSQYEIILEKEETEVTDKFQLRGAGLSMERKFELIRGKWYLVYCESINL